MENNRSTDIFENKLSALRRDAVGELNCYATMTRRFVDAAYSVFGVFKADEGICSKYISALCEAQGNSLVIASDMLDTINEERTRLGSLPQNEAKSLSEKLDVFNGQCLQIVNLLNDFYYKILPDYISGLSKNSDRLPRQIPTGFLVSVEILIKKLNGQA